METLLFWLLAVIALIAAASMIIQRNPVHSALFLIITLLSLAGLFLLLSAHFLAVIQVIVYAGAIMVLFLFVVMLLNVPREEPAGLTTAFGPGTLRMGALLSVLLGVQIVWALSKIGLGWFAQDPAATSVSSVPLIGSGLFTRHVFAFEATSILILVAMIGAVVIARREH